MQIPGVPNIVQRKLGVPNPGFVDARPGVAPPPAQPAEEVQVAMGDQRVRRAAPTKPTHYAEGAMDPHATPTQPPAAGPYHTAQSLAMVGKMPTGLDPLYHYGTYDPSKAVPVPAQSAAPVANVPSLGVQSPGVRRQVGVFEKNGVQTPIYHDQLVARQDGPGYGGVPTVQRGPSPSDRIAQQSEHVQRQIDQLIRKQATYDFGGPTPFEFQASLAALTGNLQALHGATGQVGAAQAQGDAQVRAAQAQYSNDPQRDPAYRAALIQKLGSETAYHNAQAKHFNAEAENAGTEGQFALLKRIAGDDAVRNFVLMGKGATPEDIRNYPSTPPQAHGGGTQIDAGNVGYYAGLPQNKGMADLLAEKDLPLLDRLRRAEQFPGFSDFQSPSRQLFDTWLRQAYTDPKKWVADTYVPPDPNDTWPVLGRIRGLSNALFASLPTAEGYNSGTGFGWHQNYEDAVAMQNLIKKHRISPFVGLNQQAAKKPGVRTAIPSPSAERE